MHFVVVGAQKAGTTWLHAMLSQHPEVGFSYMKEAHYFDRLHKRNFSQTRETKLLGRQIAKMQNRQHFAKKVWERLSPNWRDYYAQVLDAEKSFSDEWYRAGFDSKPTNASKFRQNPNYVRADFSPSYMCMRKTGIEHLGRFMQAQPAMLIVRDPIKRMQSGLSMSLNRKSFDKEVSAKRVRRMLNKGHHRKGNYVRAIPLLEQNLQNFSILPFKRVVTDPKGLLYQLESDLGIAHHTYENIDQKSNSQAGRLKFSNEAMREIEQWAEPQYDFLREKFGADFLKEI